MLDMLKGIQQLMTGTTELFDPNLYDLLVSCLNSIEEPRLLQALDAQWKGLLDYSEKLGTNEDPWKTCLEEFVPKNEVSQSNIFT